MDTGTLDLDLFVGREFASYKDLQDVLDAKKAAFGERWKVDRGEKWFLIE